MLGKSTKLLYPNNINKIQEKKGNSKKVFSLSCSPQGYS